MGLASVGAAGLLLGARAAVAPGGAARPVCAAAAGAYHVAVEVRHSDNETNPRLCVQFDASTPTFDPATRSITGEEALVLSGIHYQAVDFGGSLGRAVCQVGNEPPLPEGGFTRQNCFGNPYWVLWTAPQGGGWSSAGSGISNQAYTDGEAEGLSYGQPSPASPAGVCAPLQTTSTPPPIPAPTTSPGGQPTRGGIAPRQGTGSPSVYGPTGSTTQAGGGDGARPTPTPSSSATPTAVAPSPTKNQQAPGGPATEGVVAAAAAGVILLAMLLAQVLLPRPRR
jgi:hypothetical protein